MDGRAYDISNNANHGIIKGEGKLDNNGKFAKCLHLPKHSNISLGAKTFHNRPSSAITIALWVKLASSSGKHELFHTCTSNVANGKGQFHFEINDGKVRWFHRDHMERNVFNVISGNTIYLYSMMITLVTLSMSQFFLIRIEYCHRYMDSYCGDISYVNKNGKNLHQRREYETEYKLTINKIWAKRKSRRSLTRLGMCKYWRLPRRETIKWIYR